jgi:hypothetical protein
VAARDIGVGELIVVDRSVVESVLLGGASNRCLECSEEVVAPLPCNTCAWAAYCSEECKERAEKYNRYTPLEIANVFCLRPTAKLSAEGLERPF